MWRVSTMHTWGIERRGRGRGKRKFDERAFADCQSGDGLPIIIAALVPFARPFPSALSPSSRSSAISTSPALVATPSLPLDFSATGTCSALRLGILLSPTLRRFPSTPLPNSPKFPSLELLPIPIPPFISESPLANAARSMTDAEVVEVER